MEAISVIIITMVISTAIAFLVYVVISEQYYQKGYEQGQIDAINGKIKYILIELEDKSRLYVKEEDLKHYENYTVISGEEK